MDRPLFHVEMSDGNRMKRYIGLVLLLFSNTLVGETLHINSPVPIQYLRQHQAYKVFEQAKENLKLQVNYTFYPRLRSLRSVNLGDVDGDIGKAPLLPSQLENIIMVQEPVAQANVVAFSLAGDLNKISSEDDLSSYRIGYIKGWLFYQKIASHGRVAIAVMDVTTLFKMLLAGRFDVVIIEKGLGLFIAQQLNFPPKILTVSQPLANQGVYLFLHKKHKLLSAKLALEFAKIKCQEPFFLASQCLGE